MLWLDVPARRVSLDLLPGTGDFRCCSRTAEVLSVEDVRRSRPLSLLLW